MATLRSAEKTILWLSFFRHSYTAEDFPGHSLVDAVNYCRNPSDSSGGPWCYTSANEYEYCDIPFCPPPGKYNDISYYCYFIKDSKPPKLTTFVS